MGKVGELVALLERQALFGNPPGGGELGAHGGVVHALVARVQAGPHAHVAASLHVVLPTHRGQAAVRPADVPSHQGKRRQRPHGLHALRLLRDAHAPSQHGRGCLRVAPRRLTHQLGVQSRHALHVLGRVVLHHVPPRVEAFRVLVYEVPVGQVFVDDRVGKGVDQRQVRAVPKWQVHVGDAGGLDDARVAHDELRAAFLRTHDAARHDGMAGRRIVAEQQDAVRFLQRGDAHAHGARADALHEADHACRMAGARAVVDVVRAQARARELLHDEVGLVACPARRSREHDGLGPALLDDGAQAAGREVERLVPAHALKRRALGAADHRMVDARREDARVVHEVVAVEALEAQLALVRDAVLALRVHHQAVLHRQAQLAAGPAVRAHRQVLLHGLTLPRPVRH